MWILQYPHLTPLRLLHILPPNQLHYIFVKKQLEKPAKVTCLGFIVLLRVPPFILTQARSIITLVMSGCPLSVYMALRGECSVLSLVTSTSTL